MKEILLSLLILTLAALPSCASRQPETEHPTQNEQSTQNERLTEQEAQMRALEHAERTSDEVIGLRSEYDHDDNAYEVEFSFDGWEYEYKIHAVSGAVLSATQKRQG